ncbi:MAG: 2-phospho-L-lactate guanylyltransferase [Chloroflexota bacterium]
MKIWGVIPVKPFGEGKSRLSGRLNPSDRGELSRKLLAGVIQVIQESAVCTEILVISRDRSVLSFADQLGTRTLLERGSSFGQESNSQDNLNSALTQAQSEIIRQQADALLVLPADLPYLTTSDLTTLSQTAEEEESVVIAPSHDGGTNALLLRPPGCIRFDFGLNSCANHQRRAVENGLPFKLVHSDTLAFDLDQPKDLHRWSQGNDLRLTIVD